MQEGGRKTGRTARGKGRKVKNRKGNTIKEKWVWNELNKGKKGMGRRRKGKEEGNREKVEIEGTTTFKDGRERGIRRKERRKREGK